MIKKELFLLLDEMPERNISGWQLFEMMYLRTGRKTYPQTLLSYCREYADISGADFVCVDWQRSTYHYKPFLKIGTAIISGKE